MRTLTEQELQQVVTLAVTALEQHGEILIDEINAKLKEDKSYRLVLINWRDSLEKVQEKVNAVRP